MENRTEIRIYICICSKIPLEGARRLSLTPVILATQEVEIRRIRVQSQPSPGK
jgi:hypothetical protein